MARFRGRRMPPKYIRYSESPGGNNKKLKEKVYNYLSDDDFYSTMKQYEPTAKNKFIKQRLHEIENRRWREANPELAEKSDKLSMGCAIVLGLAILVIVLLSNSH